MSDLPKDYDVVVVGTGLTESILASALSRIGKSVLHIDRNPYYGGEFSSHSLTGLVDWANSFVAQQQQSNSNEFPTPNENEDESIQVLSCNNDLNKYYFDIEHNFNENSKDELVKKSRQFILDLSPNIFYAAGSLIDLLISSDVARYSEFKMVSQILTRRQNGILEKVPTSRSEVFKSSQLGMLEKRVMMQFVQSCLKDNDFADLLPASCAAETEQERDDAKSTPISYRQLIESKKLPESISHYMINAVAMCSDDSRSALDGLRSTKKFLKSVGRFGDSPFLYCMYGSGELSQCFCRIESIGTRKVEGEFLKFNCKHLVIDSSYSPSIYMKNFDASNRISRCIIITDKSIFVNSVDSNDEHVSLLYLPKTQHSSEIYLFECSPTVHCSPKGYYIVYMFCIKSNRNSTARDDFREAIDMFFSRDDEEAASREASTTRAEANEDEKSKTSLKPNILFSFFFSHLNSEEFIANCLPSQPNMPENLHILSGSSAKLDFDHQVEEAKRIFRKICPDEEFLPRPPDPEDIIIETSPMSDLDDSQESIKTEPTDTAVAQTAGGQAELEAAALAAENKNEENKNEESQ